MYFELTTDIQFDIGISEPAGLPDEIDFMAGKVLGDDVPNPVTFTTNAVAGDVLPDFWDESVPAMSEKFVKMLEGAGVDNIQTFPAVVKSRKDGTLWDGYYAVNVLGMIQCADLSKSDYDEIFPGHYRFRTLAIDSNLTKDSLIFRLQENPGTLIIHKSVGKYMGDNYPNKELKGWSVRKIIQ